MFENVGGKLKTLAIISCIVGIFGSVIGGLILIGDIPLAGILIILIGSFASWIASLSVYGLGEAVDQATDAAKNAERCYQYFSSHALSQDQKQMLDKLKEKDVQEETEKREKEIRERKEARMQHLQESGVSDWFSAFLSAADTCQRVADLKKLWDESPKDNSPLAEAVEKRIVDNAQIERFYGSTPDRVQKLLEELQTLV